MTNSRAKGKRGELEIAQFFSVFGLDTARGIQDRGPEVPDVIGLPGVWAEVKRRERLEMLKWCRQAESEAGGDMPVVFWRPNGEPWRVTQLLDDWAPMYLDCARALTGSSR